MGIVKNIQNYAHLFMKYVVLLCDGMSDYPLTVLGDRTPMEVAHKPFMDEIAKNSICGLVKTVKSDMKPGSDIANLSVLGYNPTDCYTGRSPLEAGSIGIDMKSTDVSLRCNLVTLTDNNCYEDKTIIDYCAGDIHTNEAGILIDFLAQHFNNDEFKLYKGVSYRHCLIWNNGTLDIGTLTPPHDITGNIIRDYVFKHKGAEKLYDMMKRSYELLSNHPINLARVARGERPANGIWFWGEGVKAELQPFKDKYNVSASMISAVDLLKGIGKFSGMNVVDVPGATGYLDTNFEGKAMAAIHELERGQDFVYIHVEAPDECGHRGEIHGKVTAIEQIDSRILAYILEEMNKKFDDYKLLILPDHATPLILKTHTNDAVPFMIYQKSVNKHGVDSFCEKDAKETGVFVENGYLLMEDFLSVK